MSEQIAQPAAVTPPKRHHYVPRFLSAGFVGPDKLVQCLHKADGKIVRTAPKNLFVEGQFHSTFERDGTRDPALEFYLSEVEGLAAPLLERIVDQMRRRATVTLTTDEKTVIDAFVYLQYRRVPDRFQDFRTEIGFEEILEQAKEEWRQEFPDRAHELDEMDPEETARRIFHNSRIQAIGDLSGPAFAAVRRRGVDIVVITPSIRKQFVLGSNPVTPVSNLVDGQGVQLWLPIAPDIAIGPGGVGNAINQIEIGHADTIRRFNLTVVEQSSYIASTSERLLSSLRRPR